METLTLPVTIIKLCGRPARPRTPAHRGPPEPQGSLDPRGHLASSQGQPEGRDKVRLRAGYPSAALASEMLVNGASQGRFGPGAIRATSQACFEHPLLQPPSSFLFCSGVGGVRAWFIHAHTPSHTQLSVAATPKPLPTR